ncbi:hypothetical protein PVAG01_10897 [Phlyctema vagabunda]|uniref:Cytochrome P450 n=1 Tax=Phlyctema vagabunda TaxID=108571 RepID=A0ABR4P3J8_9HELO
MAESDSQPYIMSSATVISTSLVLVLVYLVKTFAATRSKVSIAKVVGNATDREFYNTVLNAFKKDPNMAYTLPETPARVILPPRYIDEVKSLPESKISFVASVTDKFAGEYTSLGPIQQPLINSVRVDLTRSISATLEGLQNEAEFAFPEVLGPCEEWTSVHMYSKVLRIIAFLSGRIFVGLPLCRDEEWVKTTIEYTGDAFAAVEPIRKHPKFLRPLVAPFLPSLWKIANHKAISERLLGPILKERLASMQSPDFDQPHDTISYMLKNSGEKASDFKYQSHTQLNLSLAAIHTTSMALTHIIYDLCAHPEYIEDLREELASVLAADGNKLVKTSMTKLRKMDSFMKESQRLSPPSTLAMMRMTTADLKLSEGLTLPKGTSVAVSANGPNMTSPFIKDPEEFKGFRYAELRDLPGNENRFQFVTTGMDSLNFGHGSHACPGRFFASNEIKVAIAFLLQNYDLKFKEGGRPPNIYTGTDVLPNTFAEVMFRKRSV